LKRHLIVRETVAASEHYQFENWSDGFQNSCQQQSTIDNPREDIEHKRNGGFSTLATSILVCTTA